MWETGDGFTDGLDLQIADCRLQIADNNRSREVIRP